MVTSQTRGNVTPSSDLIIVGHIVKVWMFDPSCFQCCCEAGEMKLSSLFHPSRLTFFFLFLHNKVFHNLPDCWRAAVPHPPSSASLSITCLTPFIASSPFSSPLNPSFPPCPLLLLPQCGADELRQTRMRAGGSTRGPEATLHLCRNRLAAVPRRLPSTN